MSTIDVEFVKHPPQPVHIAELYQDVGNPNQYRIQYGMEGTERQPIEGSWVDSSDFKTLPEVNAWVLEKKTELEADGSKIVEIQCRWQTGIAALFEDYSRS